MEWGEEEREGRIGERGRNTLSISRFFEILKTVVDYLKRQSGKSVMTSVSQSLHKAVYYCMQQCVIYCVSSRLASVVPFSPQTKGFASCTASESSTEISNQRTSSLRRLTQTRYVPTFVGTTR